MEPATAVQDEGHWPPAGTVLSDEGSLQAPTDGQQQCQAAGRVAYARTDEELHDLLAKSSNGLAVVEYGSSWCAHCQEMFPHFYRLSGQHPRHQFIVAQLDFLEVGARGVRFTPTFAFWRKGRKSLAEGRQVDQFWGSDPRQLQDRVWLHADALGPDQADSATAAPGHNRGRADMLPTQNGWPE